MLETILERKPGRSYSWKLDWFAFRHLGREHHFFALGLTFSCFVLIVVPSFYICLICLLAVPSHCSLCLLQIPQQYFLPPYSSLYCWVFALGFETRRKTGCPHHCAFECTSLLILSRLLKLRVYSGHPEQAARVSCWHASFRNNLSM